MTSTRSFNEKLLTSSMTNRSDLIDNDARPELRTMRGELLRRIVPFIFFSMWLGCTGATVVLALYSLVAVSRTMILAFDEPLPMTIQCYLLFMAIYLGYRAIVPLTGPWPAYLSLVRSIVSNYPYFRRTACVFEPDEPRQRRTDDPADSYEANYSPNDKRLFAFHPHGILSTGFGTNGLYCGAWSKANIKWLITDILFYIPLYRDILTWSNAAPVSKESFEKLMSKDENVAVIPGGFEEATHFERGKHRAYVQSRAGFIKLALRFGYKVHPVYTFGEELTYHAFPYFVRWRLFINSFKIPAILPFGSPYCPFMPRSDCTVVTVIGSPLQLPHIKNPSRADVAKYHQQYVDSLQGLFDRHKERYAENPNAVLEIF